MKITISQENSSPISITIPDNKQPEVKSQEGFVTSFILGILIFQIICCLIATPFIVAATIKDKKAFNKAKEMIAEMSESEKREIKKFINNVFITQKTIQEQISKKFKDIIDKKIKNCKLNTCNHKLQIFPDGEIIKDLSEKSIKEFYKQIVYVLNDNTGKQSLSSTYDIELSFVIKKYYTDDNDVMLDKYQNLVDNAYKDIKNELLSSISIDKSIFSLDFVDVIEEGESCPDGSDGDCFKILYTVIELTIDKKYINKVFKPLFDKCKLIK
jgi:hypothetical protein